MKTDSNSAPVESLLAGMTLREKVGQLFIVRPEALDPSGVTEVTAGLAAALKEYPVGGLSLFAANLVSPLQITAFNRALRESCAITPFLAIDEEGGEVSRLSNHGSFDLPQYKNAASISDVPEATEMGRTIGAYLREFGFNLNFAPVADVNTNPTNPIIGTRSFSPDPETAAAHAFAMAEGLTQQGIIPTYKHFPGHGDTQQDSHKGIAVSGKTAEEQMRCEWIPFRRATARDCIMVGHVALPAITGSMIPATLSKQVVTGILKELLGFQGLIMTDGMEMGGIANDYASGEAAIAALRAGCHIILIPENFRDAFRAVLDAVSSGQLSEAWLDETVRKILLFKQAWHLLPLD